MLPVGRFTTFGVPFQSSRVGVHPHHHTPLPVHMPVHMHVPFIIPHHGGAAAHPHHHRGCHSLPLPPVFIPGYLSWLYQLQYLPSYVPPQKE